MAHISKAVYLIEVLDQFEEKIDLQIIQEIYNQTGVDFSSLSEESLIEITELDISKYVDPHQMNAVKHVAGQIGSSISTAPHTVGTHLASTAGTIGNALAQAHPGLLAAGALAAGAAGVLKMRQRAKAKKAAAMGGM